MVDETAARPGEGSPAAAESLTSVERLRATVDSFGAAAFAVVDGALFDDLPKLLRDHGLFARSLFLDHADAEIERAGPWLVPLGESQVVESIFGLIAARPAAVFWSCVAGESVLYRHLRSLNLVRIPASWVDGPPDAVAPASDDQITPSESVMFRHWDPRVLAALLPVMEVSQFSRLLGPATEIALHAPDYGGLRRVIREQAWPPVPAGMLAFRPDQMDALSSRTIAASHRRIAGFLRAHAPARTAHLNDTELLAAVREHERDAKSLGLRNEDAIAMWAYMATSVATPLRQDETVRRRLTDPERGATPDERLYALFDEWTRVDVRGFSR